MPKKKATAFNPMQIKDGWIVRLYKDGRVKSKIAPYQPKHLTKQSTPGKNRTCDAWLRSPSFCPLNYRGVVGLEGNAPSSQD